MLKRLKIKGFRKYKELSIDGLKRINFILGSNNIGKTSILEAVYAWACGQNIAPFINIPLSRGRYSNIQQPYWLMEEVLAIVNDRRELPLRMAFEGEWNDDIVRFEHTIYPSDLLTDYDSSYKKMMEQVVPRTNENSNLKSGVQSSFLIMQSPMLIARWEVSNGESTQSMDVTSPYMQASTVKPFCLAKFIDILSHTAITENIQMYGSLKREGVLDDVVREMKTIFPEVCGIDTIPYPDGTQAPVSIQKIDGTMLPIYACGDGLQRWFYILGAIELYKKSLICIDEVDVGFHYEAQEEFCRNLIKYTKRNDVQLFVTTHNIEFLDQFLSVAMQEEMEQDSVSVITLRENDEANMFIRSLSITEAGKVRKNYNMELR